jgi:formylglycine-generating enzyme required for sulfatase activity
LAGGEITGSLSQNPSALQGGAESLRLQWKIFGLILALGLVTHAPAADFEEVTVHGIVLVHIPAGSFTMGTTDEVQAPLQTAGTWTRFEECERPAHEVRIAKPFLIGQYEITQKQWAAVMGKKNAPSAFKGDTLPVDSVSWIDVQAYLAALNKLGGKAKFRLPTEAEWEYCCRAGGNGAYGLAAGQIPITRENLGDYAWFDGNAGKKTHPVGTRKPNAWGLYDMEGNVWEWVADWYGKRFYTAAPESDPQNKDTENSTERVFRGGSWVLPEANLRAAFRGGGLPDTKSAYVGFRVVCEE